jgi:hypothetical protein
MRMIRARKAANGEVPSPAMSDFRTGVEVYPITANGGSRWLMASLEKEDFGNVDFVFVVDDFMATGDTLRGGVVLAQSLLSPRLIVPMAALGKPEQYIGNGFKGSEVLPSITAMEVRYWPDEQRGQVMMCVNNGSALVMERASLVDFK